MQHNNVVIEDNFLPRNTLRELQSHILTEETLFLWALGRIMLDDENGVQYGDKLKDGSFNLMMGHLFYNKSVPLSPIFEYMVPIIEKLDPVSLIRGKINLYFGTEKHIVHGYHVDNNLKNCTTCIYFLNTNNGKLYFKDGTVVDSVENRAVIFDSQTLHSGSTCTDQKYRCTINFNYIDRRGVISS